MYGLFGRSSCYARWEKRGQTAGGVHYAVSLFDLHKYRDIDASAQMALLQFMISGMSTTAVPSSIHCDHLIVAHEGADKDVASSIVTNKEIFDFLESAAKKYGIAFWKPGSGIIHQIVLENYAAPGGLMLGTDSHTPNAGKPLQFSCVLCALCVVLTANQAVSVWLRLVLEVRMLWMPWLRYPGSSRHPTLSVSSLPVLWDLGRVQRTSSWSWQATWQFGYAFVIASMYKIKLLIDLFIKGGTGHIIEYFGPGVASLSCTGMATITNMGAEVSYRTKVRENAPYWMHFR